MATGGKNLTHDEIWDDSALVDSWNSALEEYKKYHSIHLKGGNVDEILKSASSDAKIVSSDNMNERITPKQADEPTATDTSVGVNAGASQSTSQGGNPTHGERNHPPHGATAMVPEGLLGPVRDEGLKKLLMSWYYAGYYTGFYEGQQDGQRSMHGEPQS